MSKRQQYDMPEWLEVNLAKRKITAGAPPLRVKIRERLNYKSYIASLEAAKKESK